MSALDLSKIKDAAAREHVRSGPNEYPIAHHMRRDEDRELLLAAVPDLLAEIERLKIDRTRMRDLATVVREHIDADRIATAYAALEAL